MDITNYRAINADFWTGVYSELDNKKLLVCIPNAQRGCVSLYVEDSLGEYWIDCYLFPNE